MSTNQYGLDNDYFERKIAILHRDGLRNWKPDELARELARMSRTAAKSVMHEPEFISDAIREMNDELVDLRARLAERDALLRGLVEYADGLLSDMNIAWAYAGSTGTPETHKDDDYAKAVALLSAAQCSEVDPQCSEALRTQGEPVERKRHVARTDAVYDASWVGEKLPQPKCADALRPIDPDKEIVAMVESALRRSFSLGQVYWQQADSDSTCQQNKSDQTMEVQAQHILNVVKSIRELNS